MVSCGTRGGYRKHLRANEVPCEPCKEGRRTYVNEYKTNYLEQYKTSQKNWVENNRDKVRAKNSKWRNANKDYFLVYGHKRRVLERGLAHAPYTLQEILNTYGETCHLCGTQIDLKAPKSFGVPGWEKSLHLDHLIPIARGGEDSLQNIRPSHAICNSKKHVK